VGAAADVSARNGRLLLIAVAATLMIAAIAFCIDPPRFAWTPPPSDPKQLAERIATHPADWRASNALAETALDMRAENRVAVWHAAYEHGALLSAHRADAASAFARSAFFHWGELSPREQHDALAAFAPVLHDPDVFGRMAKPIYELTGDLSYLEAARPSTADATGMLISLALANGFFADYRNLRVELERQRLAEFNASRRSATPEELVTHFPDPPYHTDQDPLLAALLDELHRRPLNDDPHRTGVIDNVIAYALRHDLGPLDGFEVITGKPGAASIEARMALARKLGLASVAHALEISTSDPRRVPPVLNDWQGLCNRELCYTAWRMIDAEHGIAITIEPLDSDNVPAYVEIYVDDALRAEGDVGAKRDFAVPVGSAAAHRIEVALLNPLTRNRASRRVHIASITTL
jgi:hypothetical protein